MAPAKQMKAVARAKASKGSARAERRSFVARVPVLGGGGATA